MKAAGGAIDTAKQSQVRIEYHIQFFCNAEAKLKTAETGSEWKRY